MKKTYFEPKTTIVNVKLTQLMAGSLNSLNDEGGEAKVIDEDATGAGLSRGGFWDDEE